MSENRSNSLTVLSFIPLCKKEEVRVMSETGSRRLTDSRLSSLCSPSPYDLVVGGTLNPSSLTSLCLRKRKFYESEV